VKFITKHIVLIAALAVIGAICGVWWWFVIPELVK